MKLIEALFDTMQEQNRFIRRVAVGINHGNYEVYQDLLDFQRYEHYYNQHTASEFIQLVVNKSKRIKNNESGTNFIQSIYNHKEYKKGEKHLSSGILNKSKQNETFRKNRLKRKKRK